MLFKQAHSVLIASFVLALSPLHSVMAETEKLTLKMTNDRVIAVEIVKPKNPRSPTFVLLPGVNRGLMASDEALETLANQGFGIVAMNFSVQPFSVNLLDKNVKPAFLDKSYSLAELGEEADALVAEVKKDYNLQNIIPVSISYSSAVSSTLKNYPFIIDVVPMTSSAAVNPELEAYRSTLKAGEIWNPVYGPGITRSLLDQAYYGQWSSQVDSMISAFKLNSDRKSDMIQGYTVLSRAAEGFVWEVSKSTTKRVFLLARNDSAGLLKDQLNFIQKQLDTNADVLAFVVNNSGHVMPEDQPVVYASILASVTNGSMKEVSGIVEYDPGTSQTKAYKGADAKKFIQNLINTL